VGIVIKGGAICGLCAVLHLGLGLDVPTTHVSGAITDAGLSAFDHRQGR